MYNYILNSVRSITLEIAKLQGLASQMAKSNDYERKHQYEEFIKWCKNEKENLLENYCPERIIENLYLSDDEKIMARSYYLYGKSWEEAFYETDEFLNIDGDEFDDAVTKKIKKCTTVKQVDTIFNSFLKGTRSYAY